MKTSYNCIFKSWVLDFNLIVDIVLRGEKTVLVGINELYKKDNKWNFNCSCLTTTIPCGKKPWENFFLHIMLMKTQYGMLCDNNMIQVSAWGSLEGNLVIAIVCACALLRRRDLPTDRSYLVKSLYTHLHSLWSYQMTQ